MPATPRDEAEETEETEEAGATAARRGLSAPSPAPRPSSAS